MKRLYLLAAVALLIALAAAPTFAQQSRGRIVGTVTAPSGAVIEGAKVTISSEALIGTSMTTETNNRGFFRFVLLPVGTYKIKIESAGYSPIEESDIKLDFDATATVNKTLQPSEFEQVITVRGEAPIVDKTSSTMSDKIDADFLKQLPSTRDIYQMPALTAGFNDESSLGGTYQAGNLYSADGMDVSDPTTKRPKDVVAIEAVEQLDIAKFGAQAEYSAFTGAAINIVTKSGGNDFHGDAGYYMRRVNWTDDNTEEYREEGITAPTASDMNNPTFALGGPVLKDRVWFFGAYSQEDWTTQHEIMNNEIFDGMNEVKNWFLKLSGRWDERNITYVSYTGWSDRIDDWARYSSYRENFADTLCNWDQRIDSYLVQHSFVLNSDVVIEGRYNEMLYDSLQYPKNQGPTIRDSKLGNIHLVHTISRYDLNYKKRQNVDISANIFRDEWMGSHSIKTGFQYGKGVTDTEYSHEEYIEYRNGVPYRWRNYGTYRTVRQAFRYGAYLQDSWTLNDRLTLNLGFRYDYNYSKGIDDGGLSQGAKFRITHDPALRLGFAYDLFGDGKTVLRGFYGRYYEGIVSGNIRPMIASIPPTYDYRWNKTTGQWYLYDVTGGTDNFAMSDDLTNAYTEGFIVGVERQLSDVMSGAATFVYKWDDGFNGRTYPDITWTEETISFSNENGSYSGVNYKDVSLGSLEYFVNIDTSIPGVLVDPYRHYYAMIFEFEKRMQDNWSLKASYTWSRNTGNIYNDDYDVIQGFTNWSSPNQWINSEGILDLDRTNVIKVSGTYIAPFDIFISPVATWMTGRPAGFYYTPDDSDSIRIKERDGKDRYDSRFDIDLRIEKTFFFMDRYRFGILFDVFNLLNDDAVTGWLSNNIESSNFGLPSSIIGPRYAQIGIRFQF